MPNINSGRAAEVTYSTFSNNLQPQMSIVDDANRPSIDVVTANNTVSGLRVAVNFCLLGNAFLFSSLQRRFLLRQHRKRATERLA